MAMALWVVPRLAQAGCPKGSKAVDHEVKSGQTLSHIAVKHDVSISSIERANPKVEPKSIRPGQVLTVCIDTGSSSSKAKKCGKGGTVETHTVKSGENLGRIAARYNITEKSIIGRNKSLAADPNALRIGQELSLCVGEKASGSSRPKKSKMCGGETPIYKHEVVPGEWLSAIASRYGVRRRDLYRINPRIKANPNRLRPGDVVLVCPDIPPRRREKIRHSVSSGETLSEIASDYDLTTRELVAYQKGKVTAKSMLRVGQELTVWKDGSLVPGFGGYENDKGKLPSGVQLKNGSGLVVKTPGYAWGEASTIRLIQSAVSRYSKRAKGEPKVHIGDISKKGGGKFPPHKSHQKGKDVDIGYVLKGDLADEKRFKNANAKNLDVDKTWKLIKAFIDTNEVKYIFMDRSVQKLLYDHAKKYGVSQDTLDELFQYPRRARRTSGVIRHSKGHVNHFHVRFR